ncbi:MAG TPA: PLP-dependent aminotransferase family protein [Bryobacteraceae bacterium]|nr:PLP-dependent aminotransferase family protein [Bryobacteraceae bacterium]
MIPKPQLDPQSEVPLYQQLHRHFMGLIQSGLLKRGERLPPTRELAGLLGLNRTTVSAAYELLEAEGLITGQVGRGSFVTGGDSGPIAGVNWDAILEASHVTPAQPARKAGPDAISFAVSRPSEELFPLEDFRASCEEVMAGADFASVLQLGSPGGYEPLRQYLIEESRREGVLRPGDDLMITTGCQQALDLVRRVVMQPGDKVLVEEPVYPGLRNLFLESGVDLAGIPVLSNGIDVAQFERALAKARFKALVLTPNFQNPTGATMNREGRETILRLARNAATVLIENDIYGQLRYEGEALPTLKQMDSTGDSILLRSFSKISFPGLRVGWAIGPRPLIARMMEAKQLSDLHSDQFSQATLLHFALSGRLKAHHDRILKAGAERLKVALTACEQYLPAGSRFTRPQGGMNLWVRLPEPLDASELLGRVHRGGVSYLPGKYFAVNRPEPGSLRLSFAGVDPDKIEKGIKILGEIFSTELERQRASRDREPAPAMV